MWSIILKGGNDNHTAKQELGKWRKQLVISVGIWELGQQIRGILRIIVVHGVLKVANFKLFNSPGVHSEI